MRSLTKALVIAAVAACAFSMPGAQAQEVLKMDSDMFVKMCDSDKDGMVSKAEMMKMVEKMFEKHDTKKIGKLDKKQVEAFLKEFNKPSGS